MPDFEVWDVVKVPFPLRVARIGFVNTSPFDLKTLMGDQDNLLTNLAAWIRGFSPAVRDIFERFRFAEQLDRLQKAGLLYQVTERFASFPLHPDRVSNHDMGLAFEELIRKFAEVSNETAGEHFTPRDVIRLMVSLLFIEDSDLLTPGTSAVRTICDPTAGTGGMLSVAGEYLLDRGRLEFQAARGVRRPGPSGRHDAYRRTDERPQRGCALATRAPSGGRAARRSRIRQDALPAATPHREFLRPIEGRATR